MYDELLAVNNTDVSQMDHADIVGLIKSSGISIQLTVQQPEDLDLIVRQQMVKRYVTTESVYFTYMYFDRQYPLLYLRVAIAIAIVYVHFAIDCYTLKCAPP
jgi:hypothetical protein